MLLSQLHRQAVPAPRDFPDHDYAPRAQVYHADELPGAGLLIMRIMCWAEEHLFMSTPLG